MKKYTIIQRGIKTAVQILTYDAEKAEENTKSVLFVANCIADQLERTDKDFNRKLFIKQCSL